MALFRPTIRLAQRRGRIAAASMALLLAIAVPAGSAYASGFDLSPIWRLFGRAGEAPPATTDNRVTAQNGRFQLAEADWATFERVPVVEKPFIERIHTEGRLAIDENSAVPVVSPYSGRAQRIAVVPGDFVRRGQPLVFLEANDMVQVQNDFVAAVAALDKAGSQLRLAQVNERRQTDLFAGRATTQRDLDQARADLDAAKADHQAASTALEAVENRLRLFGKTNEEIRRFRAGRQIDPVVAILSPIEGTVVSRRIGQGQFIAGGGSEPVFVIDDLDTLWLNVYVREEDAPRVVRGATVEFRVLAFRDRKFQATLDFVAPTIDAANRRLLVRATVDNPDRQLKQQMFANVAIQVGDAVNSPAIPRRGLIYEGDIARVWVSYPDRSVELRRVQVGIVRDEVVQIVSGLKAGEEVVVGGALFLDQMTAAFRR